MLSHGKDSPHSIRFWILLFLVSLTAQIVFSPAYLEAQSPLTVQPSTGRVGIGNSAPAYPLDVTGTVNATAFRGDGSQLTGLPTGGGTSQWTTSGTSIYYNGGNVGIGEAAPDNLLDVLSNGTALPAEITAYNTGTGNSFGLLRLFRQSSATSAQAGLIFSLQNSTPARKEYGYIAARIRTNTAGTEAGDLIFSTTDAGITRVERMRITSSGNVGIGTTAPTSLLHVNGTLTATTKNFQIDHPLEPEKKLLVHSALEGPEVAVYYRGEAQLLKGEVLITLPSYFEALTGKEQRTVQLTPIRGWSPLYVADEISDGHFTVRTANGGNSSQRFYWEVKAVRADVPPLVVEKLKPVEEPQAKP